MSPIQSKLITFKILIKKYELESLIGFILGAFYLPSSEILSLAGSYLSFDLQSVTFFIYPLCLSIFGLGLVSTNKWLWLKPVPRSMTIALAIVILITASIFLPSSIKSSERDLKDTLSILILIASVYFLFGLKFSMAFSQPEKTIFKSIGYKMLFQTFGYVFSLLTITLWGANGILAFICCLTLIQDLKLKLKIPCILILILIPWGSFDKVIETEKIIHFQKIIGSTKQNELVNDWKLAEMHHWNCSKYQAEWSHRGLFNVCAHKNNANLLLNLSNFIPTFIGSSIKNINSLRNQVYNLFSSKEHIAIIGFGSGRSIDLIQESTLTKNIYALERNPSTVSFFMKNGDSRLQKINYLNFEGRSFVEQSKENFDWIYIESSKDHGDLGHLSMFSPFSLATEEALNGFLSKLTPNGVFVFEVNRILHSNLRQGLFKSVHSFFKETINPLIYYKVLYDMKDQTTPANGYIIASFNKSKLDSIVKKNSNLLSEINTKPSDEDNAMRLCAQPLTDSKPFLTWNCKKNSDIFVQTLYFVFFISIILWLIIFYKSGKNIALFQFSIFTIFGTIFFIVNVYKMRSYFVDEIISFYVLTIYFYIIYGLVGIFFNKWEKQLSFFFKSLWPMFFVILFQMAVLIKLPFDQSLLIRSIYFVIAFFPATVFCANYYYSLVSASISLSKVTIQQTLALELFTLILSYAILSFSLLYLGINLTYFVGAIFLILTHTSLKGIICR